MQPLLPIDRLHISAGHHTSFAVPLHVLTPIDDKKGSIQCKPHDALIMLVRGSIGLMSK